jgi:hypothetical protein
MTSQSIKLIRFNWPLTLIFILGFSLIGFWLTTIQSPGLHGDEAWFGMKAFEYRFIGILQPYGMNFYTGILQAGLNALVFYFFDFGILQLRIIGIIFNGLALILLTTYLYIRVNPRVAAYTLLLFSQSLLYLVYPKVAWEVCSFTLIFLVLFLISINELNQKKRSILLWQAVLFISSALGSYNHILFSSLPMATFVGLLLWKGFNGKSINGSLVITTLFINSINVILLFLYMKWGIALVWQKIGFLSFAIPLVFIIAELLFLANISHSPIKCLDTFSAKIGLRWICGSILLACALIFLYFHGRELVQIFSQRILFIRFFSYDPPSLLKNSLKFVGIILIIYLFFQLLLNLIRQPKNPLTFVLITYLGIFCLYTTDFSIRYFLIPFALIYIFLGYQLSLRSHLLNQAIIGFIIVGTLLAQGCLWYLAVNPQRPIKAVQFSIGNGRIETSAHFIPADPLIKYMLANQASNIITRDQFFIGNVVDFYKTFTPDLLNKPNAIEVNYEAEQLGDGFSKKLILKP